jgi:hypothetical protein
MAVPAVAVVEVAIALAEQEQVVKAMEVEMVVAEQVTMMLEVAEEEQVPQELMVRQAPQVMGVMG